MRSGVVAPAPGPAGLWPGQRRIRPLLKRVFGGAAIGGEAESARIVHEPPYGRAAGSDSVGGAAAGRTRRLTPQPFKYGAAPVFGESCSETELSWM